MAFFFMYSVFVCRLIKFEFNNNLCVKFYFIITGRRLVVLIIYLMWHNYIEKKLKKKKSGVCVCDIFMIDERRGLSGQELRSIMKYVYNFKIDMSGFDLSKVHATCWVLYVLFSLYETQKLYNFMALVFKFEFYQIEPKKIGSG